MPFQRRPIRRDAEFQVEVISTREGFAALRAEWDALADRLAAAPMARHAWLSAAADALPRGELAVVVARDAHGLRAAAPFAVSHGPVKTLVWLSWQMREPETLLYDDPRALAAVWERLRRLGLPICARRLSGGAAEAGLLRDPRPMRGACIVRPGSSRTAAAPVAGDWSAFEAGMSSKLRTNMRQARRGLEKMGELAFHALSPSPSGVDAILQELIRIEASGWKGRERSAIQFRPELERFWRDYAHRAAEEGTLRLFFLSLDGKNIAVQLLVEQANRLWQFKIGYDETYAKHSPGQLLMIDILRWANSTGLEAVEYLGQGGPWQSRCPVQFRDHDTVRFYPRTLGAGVAFAADTVEYLRRKRRPAAGIPPKQARPDLHSPAAAASA